MARFWNQVPYAYVGDRTGSALAATHDALGRTGVDCVAHWPAPANFTLKLVRPGFGPAAELPTFAASAAASRRLQLATRFSERHARQPARRFGFGTRDRPHSLA